MPFMCTSEKVEELRSEMWSTLQARSKADYLGGSRRGLHPDDLLYKILRHLNPSVVMRLSKGISLTMHFDHPALTDWFLHLVKVRAERRILDLGLQDVTLRSEGGVKVFTEFAAYGARDTFELMERMKRSKVYGDGSRWRAVAIASVLAHVAIVLGAFLLEEARRTRASPVVPDCSTYRCTTADTEF